MKIRTLMVVRNEAGRYFPDVLARALSFSDEVFVFDDQSDDDTAAIALDLGAVVKVRPDNCPSFMEHEGRYRSTALAFMVDYCHMEPGDWVLVLDADEYLTSSATDTRSVLKREVYQAQEAGCEALRLTILSVFAVNGAHLHHGDEDVVVMSKPLVRADGLWTTLNVPRLWQWQPGWGFANKAMACENYPTQLRGAPMVEVEVETLALLHYGYARLEDRVARYDRYSGLEDHGHNPKFIQSIVETPTLVAWDGRDPVARYRRTPCGSV